MNGYRCAYFYLLEALLLTICFETMTFYHYPLNLQSAEIYAHRTQGVALMKFFFFLFKKQLQCYQDIASN